MKFFSQLTTLCLFVLLLFVPGAFAFGPAAEMPSGSAISLGDDLAVELRIPLFAEEFSDLPVAVVDGQPLRLGELTPELEATKTILFWETETSGAELTEQFNRALASRLPQKNEGQAKTTVFTSGRINDQRQLTMDVPLFSELFTDVPVATIDGGAITIAEFSRDLQAVHNEASGDHAHSGMSNNIDKLIKRLITVRLVEREARNIGFDQIPSFQKQLEKHAQKTLLYGLLNRHTAKEVLDEAEVNKFYRQVSLEAKLESYRFSSEAKAKALLDEVAEGEDFDQLISAAVKDGTAVGSEEQGYTRLKDLLVNIATAANTIDIGEVSEVFRQADGFVLFKLADRRFVEDPQALQFARNSIWEAQRANAGTEYINQLIEQYTVIDEDVQADLDFAAIKQANPDIQLSAVLEPLLKDQRILAQIPDSEFEPVTVSEVANRIKDAFFHGTDIPLKPAEVDETKDEIIQDILFRMAGTLEAKKQGLDQQPGYLRQIEAFERSTLFDIFMQKVLTPEIRYGEDKVQAYYTEHLDEYKTPAMLKLKSLPFYQLKDAEDAADKLRKGSDFKWVSANSEGLVDIQDADLLQFDKNILSVTALPQNLQQSATAAERGDTLVHAEPNNFYYVLYFENVYPSEAKPYEQVRDEILKIVYRQEVDATLDLWVAKLREAYPTQIYLVSSGGAE